MYEIEEALAYIPAYSLRHKTGRCILALFKNKDKRNPECIILCYQMYGVNRMLFDMGQSKALSFVFKQM